VVSAGSDSLPLHGGACGVLFALAVVVRRGGPGLPLSACANGVGFAVVLSVGVFVCAVSARLAASLRREFAALKLRAKRAHEIAFDARCGTKGVLVLTHGTYVTSFGANT
jgi:hypothetical protein